jgi:SAM-dependent methyltransferase
MHDLLYSQFKYRVGAGLVLNIGWGPHSTRTDANWINLDIEPHEGCDLIADAHWLPFRDNSLEGVHSSGVFEHLHRPFRVASEIYRVLRPGGVMLCEVPFLWPMHNSPSDCFRYTPDGLQSVFSQLKTIDVVPSLGPLTAMALMCEHVAGTLLPGRSGFVPMWLAAWIMHPLKFLDPWFVRHNPASATAYAILMQKPE